MWRHPHWRLTSIEGSSGVLGSGQVCIQSRGGRSPSCLAQVGAAALARLVARLGLWCIGMHCLVGAAGPHDRGQEAGRWGAAGQRSCLQGHWLQVGRQQAGLAPHEAEQLRLHGRHGCPAERQPGIGTSVLAGPVVVPRARLAARTPCQELLVLQACVHAHQGSRHRR